MKVFISTGLIASAILLLSVANGVSEGVRIPLAKDTWLSQDGRTLDLGWEGMSKSSWFEIEFGELRDVRLKWEVRLTDANNNPVNFVNHSLGVDCLLNPGGSSLQEYNSSTGTSLGIIDIGDRADSKNGLYSLRFEVAKRNVRYKADVRWTTPALPKPQSQTDTTAAQAPTEQQRQIERPNSTESKTGVNGG